MEPTILRFIIFIGAYVLLLGVLFLSFAVVGSLVLRTQTLKNEYALFMELFGTIVSIIFMVIFVKILTGEYYFTPFMIIFIASVIIMMLVEFIWLIFGSTNIPWFGRAVWAGYEFKKVHPNLDAFTQLCLLAIFVVYPVYIGYGFFGDIFASADWIRYVLQSTIVILIGASWLALIPNILNLMISRNIMEGTRSRIFANLLVNSVLMLLFFSLFVWTTNTPGTTISLLGDHFVFSTTVAYAIAAYLIIVVILPYLIGHFRAKHWTQFLQLQQKEVLISTRKAFAVANTNDVLKALNEAEDLIQQSQDNINNDESMFLANELSKTDDMQNRIYRIGLESSISRDPRFIHIKKLNEVRELVVNCKSKLETNESDKDKREILDVHLCALDQHEKYEPQNSKAWGLILIAFLVGAILSPVISSIGKLVTSQLGLLQQ